jgi:TRAP-type transport system small permease protein
VAPFLSLYRDALAGIGQLERWIGILLVFNIVLNITAQVFSRYLLGRPLVWVEELATYSFIWVTFIGASLALKYRRHIRIETFVGRLTARHQALLRLVIYLLVAVLLVMLMQYAPRVIAIEGRSYSISLPVRVPRSWFYSVPLFVSTVSMMLTTVYYILAEARAAVVGTPVPPILTIADEHAEDMAGLRDTGR